MKLQQLVCTTQSSRLEPHGELGGHTGLPLIQASNPAVWVRLQAQLNKRSIFHAGERHRVTLTEPRGTHSSSFLHLEYITKVR